MRNESQNSPDALERVFRYHEHTKHHFERYASGPGYLDWATQPDPFRRYAGARLVPLKKIPTTDEPLYDDAFVHGRIPPAPLTLRTISQLFFDSLAISAWKSTGQASWALRVNPSSEPYRELRRPDWFGSGHRGLSMIQPDQRASRSSNSAATSTSGAR